MAEIEVTIRAEGEELRHFVRDYQGARQFVSSRVADAIATALPKPLPKPGAVLRRKGTGTRGFWTNDGRFQGLRTTGDGFCDAKDFYPDEWEVILDVD